MPLLGGVAISLALTGCGDEYRPVVTPVNPTGPAAQPQDFVVVTTSTGMDAPGLANVFDGSGDTLLAQATLGNGPLAATMAELGSPVVNANNDGTVDSYDAATTLESNKLSISTLLSPNGQTPQPYNMISTVNDLFVALPTANPPAAAVLSGAGGLYQLAQELPLPASPIGFAGNPDAQRIYAISQDNGSNSVTFGACNTPSSVTTPGVVKSIELSTVTISATLPVGICPVYGISTSDNLRTFILNRGSGTVTVINSQLNQLDNTQNLPNINPATGTLTLPPPAGYTGPAFNAGPVYADYFPNSQQLVTANYDSNTISIINVSTDEFGNDSALFGQTVTVPVGKGPSALSILRDGTRVYVANQKDGTVSVVNMTTFQVEATVPVIGHPIGIATVSGTPYGQVYVIPSDQPYMSVIRTDTDQVWASVQLDGDPIDIHATTQAAGSASTPGTGAAVVNTSHAPGSGAPCGYGIATCYSAATPP
jgi:YVTN family beta-propeller protein